MKCNNSFFVAGTNGGRMTCGSTLTDLTGHKEVRLCPHCEIIQDMLIALQDMVDMFERHIHSEEGPDNAAARWDNARAAIRKATGT